MQATPAVWPIKPSKIAYPPKLSTELQRRNYQSVDRMTLVGSPISPKDPHPPAQGGTAATRGFTPSPWGGSNLSRPSSARYPPGIILSQLI